MTSIRLGALLCGTTAVVALSATSASAQTRTDPPQATSTATATEADSRAEDDIVVTATRREQRLQDVPIAVTAVSGTDLARSNFKEVADIQYLASNITFSSTNPVSNGGGYQIRGVGTQTFDSGVEQSVGLVVDGVVIGLSRDPGATGFADIERIEVLRGPQGTLFGKNSSSGVIQIITRRPRLGTRSLDLELSFGERNDQVERATANLPLGDAAAIRLSGFHTSQDGAIPNVVNGTRVGDRDNYGLRGKLLFEPSAALSILLTGEYQTGFARDAQTIASLGTSALYNSQFARFAVKPGPGVYLAYQDGDWTAKQRLWSATGQIDLKLGEHTLTSITAYRSLESVQVADIDGAPVNIFNTSNGGVDSDQLTQELRLTSPAAQRLQYVAGLYYYRTRNDGGISQYGNFYGRFGVPVVLGGGRRDQSNRTRSLAAFGEATFALTDALKVIGGLRYTDDRNRGTLTVTRFTFPSIVLTPGIPYDGTVTAHDLSGRAGLQFQPSRAFNLYATYSTGYKGPAIDGTSGIVTRVRPETVKSYEIGLKSTFLDGRGLFNVALYQSDFRDFQTNALDLNRTPAAFILSNAGGLRARGVELETGFRVTDAIRLSANGAYSDAVFRSYIGPCFAGQPTSAPGGGGCFTQPGTTSQVADYAGFRLPNAPKWSYALRADFNQPVGNDLKLDAGANWAWRSATQATIGDPKARIGSYGLLNGTVGLGGQDGAWRVGAYVRNLLDRRFFAPYASTATINPGGYFRIVNPDAFRTIGGAVSFKF